REVTLPETGAATVNLINGSGKPVSVAITAHPAPDRIQVSTLPDGVETYGVWGPVHRCRQPHPDTGP
ncbi:hypothetical protein, partial [Escherichia coli]|uniref:hypothetical protein n=1 Tax=Escherichia coli TaxID=562 RepID=UPI00197AD46B